MGLSLGSNIGDRRATLCAARDRLAALPGVRLIAQSPLYETEPVGVKPEHQHLRFLNAVLILETDRPLADLQPAVQDVEQALGRVRGPDRFAPRTIDVDILYAGAYVHETDQLTLPHPRWARRRFVVQPLADLRPELVLPGERHTVREILAALPPGEAVSLFSRAW